MHVLCAVFNSSGAAPEMVIRESLRPLKYLSYLKECQIFFRNSKDCGETLTFHLVHHLLSNSCKTFSLSCVLCLVVISIF